jgi:hypothetical protein
MYNTTLDGAQLAPRSFDVVTAWDVLEHVCDPVSFLGRCREVLRQGGYVFLNVPDISSLQARLLGSRWPLLLPSHLSYFDRSSLTVCARRAGLEVIRFGRRPAWFSFRYLCTRLSEHGVPGARVLSRLVATRFPGSLLVPIFAGELYAVCRSNDEG